MTQRLIFIFFTCVFFPGCNPFGKPSAISYQITLDRPELSTPKNYKSSLEINSGRVSVISSGISGELRIKPFSGFVLKSSDNKILFLDEGIRHGN